nr:hypothetical protein [Paracoccus sp. SY]
MEFFIAMAPGARGGHLRVPASDDDEDVVAGLLHGPIAALCLARKAFVTPEYLLLMAGSRLPAHGKADDHASTKPTLHASPKDHRAWTSATALLLLVPPLAMQVTDQVNWGVFDFATAALLIGCVALAWELSLRMTCNRVRRRTIALALAASFLLLWIELAVGIIGN